MDKIYTVQIYKECEDGDAIEKGFVIDCGFPFVTESVTTASMVGSAVTQFLNSETLGNYGYRFVEGIIYR